MQDCVCVPQTDNDANRRARYAKIRQDRAANAVSGYQVTFEQDSPRVPQRHARTQIEQARKLQQAEHLGEYNIWYNRYQGENSFEKAPRASTRVVLETDAGLTRADYTNPNAHICLHFARGGCTQGKICMFRHCAPTEDDETQTDAPHDCFGRNRHGRCTSPCRPATERPAHFCTLISQALASSPHWLRLTGPLLIVCVNSPTVFAMIWLALALGTRSAKRSTSEGFVQSRQNQRCQ
jgi:hypothetical protein